MEDCTANRAHCLAELEDAAAEIDRLVARNALLEQELDATGAQLHDARAHARSQDSVRVCV